MLSFSSKRESNLPLNTLSFALTISMPSIFLEKDGDTIYEELEEDNLEEAEDEYREDKLDQMQAEAEAICQACVSDDPVIGEVPVRLPPRR